MAKAIRPLSVRKLADRSEGERVPMLVVPAAAALEREDGSLAFPPGAAERILVNPETPGLEHEPWPFAGLEVVGEPPARTRVPVSWVQLGRSEGWLELVGERVEHKPGGPFSDPWRVTHTFVHADELVLKCVDGDVRYRVARQPDKYDGGPEPGTGRSTSRVGDPETSVDWFYELELVDG